MAVRLNLNVRIVGGVGLYSEQHQLQELQVRPRRQLCTAQFNAVSYTHLTLPTICSV